MNRLQTRPMAILLVAALLLAHCHALIVPSNKASAPGVHSCQLPASGSNFATATAAQQNFDPVKLDAAIAYASTHNRLSVKVFRRNCLVAQGLQDVLSDGIPNNVWSVTKSVVSILTGMAIDDGKMHLDDPIDRYLPNTPDYGDAAHRKITIRNLLTETAGLRESIGTEAATTGTDPNIVIEAMNEQIQHPNGTFFEYAQRVPDVLAYCVQRAVGQDLQDYAQARLFDPIGIAKSSYFWLRDRSGNTYGYAHLFLPPAQLAKLGLLMSNDGTWNGKRLLSSSYIKQAAASSSTNPCYGFLFWTNRGDSCTAANFPSAQTYPRSVVPPAPKDAYAMVGFLWQDNFIIPSLDIMVMWTGIAGDYTSNLSELFSAAPGPLIWNFFTLLMQAVNDKDKIPANLRPRDSGFYKPDALQLDVNPLNYANPAVLLTDLFPTKDCNVFFCNGTLPTQGLIQNIQAIAGTRPGL